MTHPMDDFPVRQMRFDYPVEASPIWSHSAPDFSMFMNALGLHVPYFERFLVAVLRKVRPTLNDEQLRRDVRGIIGQEAHHAFNFVQWNATMARDYPRVPELEASARAGFDARLEKRSLMHQVGFVAGYETFTFLGGIIVLDRYRRYMDEAEPNLRSLWLWHQVEEVEHGSVAFDVYQALYGEHEWARKWYVISAFTHIAFETLSAYAHMVNREGYWRRPLRALRAWGFFLSFAKDLAASALPVLKRGYHPRLHPICNDEQNPIAVGWRKRYEAGLDNHALSDATLNEMLPG
ncbi:MAG: metal-dependent hydrolase [Pseudomonadota bacterium]